MKKRIFFILFSLFSFVMMVYHFGGEKRQNRKSFVKNNQRKLNQKKQIKINPSNPRPVSNIRFQKRSVANHSNKRVVGNFAPKDGSTYEAKYLSYFNPGEFQLSDSNFLISTELVADMKSRKGESPFFEISNHHVHLEQLDGDPFKQNDTTRVLYNTDTKTYALLTGTVIVTANNEMTSQDLKEKFSLIEQRRLSHLNMIFAKASNNISIVDLEETLKTSPLIKEFEIEIIQGEIDVK